MATVRTAAKGISAKGNRKRPAAKSPSAKARARAKAKKASGPSVFMRMLALGGGRSGEIAGVLALGASIFFILSLLSLQLGDGLMMGPFGRSFAVLGYSAFGIGAHVAAAGAALVSVRLLMERETIARGSHLLGLSLGLVSLAVLMHLVADSYRIAGYGPGGLVGQKISDVFVGLVSTTGTALVASVSLLVSIVIATPLRMRSLLVFFGGASKTVGQGAYSGARRVGQDAAKFSGEVIRAVLPERDHDEYLDDEYDDDYEDYDDEEDLEEDASAEDPPIIDARSGPIPVPTAAEADDTEKVDSSHMEKAAKKSRKKTNTLAGVGKAIASGPALDEHEEDDEEEVSQEEEEEVEIAELKPTAKELAAAAKKAKAEAEALKAAEPLIVESQFQATNAKEMKKKEAEVEENRLEFIKLHDGEYELPSLDYLDFDEDRDASIDRGAMLELSAKLVTTLENYGVKGHVAAIRPGPVVTMYEFAPAAGTRLNKIVNLSDDLAMSLEAMKVRIVAPIPGKAAVGIEVPNKKTEMVYLKEIIADEGFRNEKFRLPISLGKDIEGAPVSVDLASMPHLMVAGTTGSGKSVSVNSMITSLLYSRTPEEVRMIMIDPKMLELSIYEGIPHLLLPVVTDPKKANLALRWAVDEMERRYGLLAKMGVRDIRSYNAKMETKQAQWNAGKLQRIADQAKKLADAGDFDEVETTEVRQGELDFDDTRNREPEKPLPFIVVVIDEFADLMMCAPKEVETSVARIAQKARAAGIHLILATQRPSVDVITGLIKANFPSRIAFRVSSKVDSRTVLDQSGAENLLGSGDMLFSDRGAAPVRLHGCFVDEEEIHQVVSFLKTQGKPVYNLDIIRPREEDEDESEEGDGEGPRDELYDKAVNIVAEAQRVSVSYLQRRLSVGYNRSAKLVERMEREGVVSSPDNKKQREVLIAAA